jgi:hypothetical protein
VLKRARGAARRLFIALRTVMSIVTPTSPSTPPSRRSAGRPRFDPALLAGGRRDAVFDLIGATFSDAAREIARRSVSRSSQHTAALKSA